MVLQSARSHPQTETAMITEHDIKRLTLVNEKLKNEDSAIFTDGLYFFCASLPIPGFIGLQIDPVRMLSIQDALDRISVLRGSARIARY